MVHVAEAAENNGRVIMHVRLAPPRPAAIAAAVRVAQAFGAAIEAVFIEDEELIDLACFGFVREISRDGRSSAVFGPQVLSGQMASTMSATWRAVSKAAQDAGVAVALRRTRGPWVRALGAAAVECGAWNIVVASDDSALSAIAIRRQVREVPGTTGLVVAGSEAHVDGGTIVLLLERIERLPAMLRAADRLAEILSAPILLCLVGADARRCAELEGDARLALGERTDVTVRSLEIVPGATPALVRTLRGLAPGFLVAELDGLVLPEDVRRFDVVADLTAPVLIVP
jgi:hypothetical protein